MEDGLLSLKWNNHKSTFFHILSNLRKRESYTDATIACEGRFFPVHKLVMSTCSDYFSDIFQRTTCKAPVVILKDIGYQEIEALLDYMYLGEVDVKQSELAGLIKAAECLRIKGLAVPDEDPNTSTPKRSTHIPECRSSPSAKRHRRDSDSSDDPHYYSHSKGQRSHSPLNQSSASSRSQSTSSTPVPSQTTEIETLAIVPSQSMPPPSYSESRRTTHQSSSSSHSLSISEPLGQEDNSGVAFIKVEVDDEKGNKSKDKSHKSLHISTRDNSRGEGGVCRDEGNAQEKNSLSNNYSEYCNNEADIDKEEQEQMGVFNGSEIPGPSGVQSASQLMGWGEEEGPFPHNLFGSEDGSHQQVRWNKERQLRVELQRLEDAGYINIKKSLLPRSPEERAGRDPFVDEEEVSFEGFHSPSSTPNLRASQEPTTKARILKNLFRNLERTKSSEQRWSPPKSLRSSPRSRKRGRETPSPMVVVDPAPNLASMFKDYNSYWKYLEGHKEAIAYEVHLDEPDVVCVSTNVTAARKVPPKKEPPKK